MPISVIGAELSKTSIGLSATGSSEGESTLSHSLSSTSAEEDGVAEATTVLESGIVAIAGVTDADGDTDSACVEVGLKEAVEVAVVVSAREEVGAGDDATPAVPGKMEVEPEIGVQVRVGAGVRFVPRIVPCVAAGEGGRVRVGG